MKIGDYVKINENMVIGEAYGDVILLKGMYEYCGKILKVRDIGWDAVWVEDCNYLFSEEMVTLVPYNNHFMMITNSDNGVVDLSIRSNSGKSHIQIVDNSNANSNDARIPFVHYDYISNINPTLVNYEECMKFIERLHKITPIKFIQNNA